jgi:hypothetical protein
MSGEVVLLLVCVFEYPNVSLAYEFRGTEIRHVFHFEVSVVKRRKRRARMFGVSQQLFG